MKRDMDLIRTLLFYFENKSDSAHVEAEDIILEGFDQNSIQYHIVIMCEAELLSCEKIQSTSSDRLVKAIPFRLTWEGHEYLDAARNDSVWNQAKEILGNQALSFSFAMSKSLLKKILMDKLGLSQGPN